MTYDDMAVEVRSSKYNFVKNSGSVSDKFNSLVNISIGCLLSDDKYI